MAGDVLGVGRRAHLRLVGRLELQVAEREQRRVGEREREADLDLLLALGLEAELVGDLAQHRELLLGDLVHRLDMQGLSPGRPGRSGRCAPASLPLAKVEQPEIIATVPAGEV